MGVVRYAWPAAVSLSLGACTPTGPRLGKPQAGVSVHQFTAGPNDLWTYALSQGGEFDRATVETIVDWTSPSNDIDVAFLRGQFSKEQLVGMSTLPSVLGQSATKAKPERLVVSIERGDYTVVVINRGPSADSGTLQMSFRFD